MEITESNKCIVIKESTGNLQIFDILSFQFPRMDENESDRVNERMSSQCNWNTLCIIPSISLSLFTIILAISVSFTSPFPIPIAIENTILFCLLFLILRPFVVYCFEAISLFFRKSRSTTKKMRKTKKEDASRLERKFINLQIVLQRQVIYY